MSAVEVFDRIDECEAYEPLVDAVLARLNIGMGRLTYLHTNIPFKRFMELVFRRICVLEDRPVDVLKELRGNEAALFQLFSDVIDEDFFASLGRDGVFNALRIVYQRISARRDRPLSDKWYSQPGVSVVGSMRTVFAAWGCEGAEIDLRPYFPLDDWIEVEAVRTDEEVQQDAEFAAVLDASERSRRLMQAAMNTGSSSTFLGSPSRISRGRRRHGGGKRRARGRGNSSRYSVTSKKGKDWIGG